MKKLCIMTAIVLSAVMLFSSCGKPKSPAIKLTLDVEDNNPSLPGPGKVLQTYKAETIQKAVERFAAEAPDIYNSDEMHKLVEQFGDFYLPDNGDEILECTVAACEDELAAGAVTQHGETELILVKFLGVDIPDTVEEVQVGDKTVYYISHDYNGRETISALYYELENGDVLHIFKYSRTNSVSIYEFDFTIDEITALGEDFFSFKPEALKDYFGDDYFAEDTEDTQE